MSNTTDALSRLVRAIEDTEKDIEGMPFFVRPMAKKGFASRTGRSLEEWLRAARDLESQEKGGKSLAELEQAAPDLRSMLETLADNYATAPERAAKTMGRVPSILEKVKKNSAEREEAVRAVLALL